MAGDKAQGAEDYAARMAQLASQSAVIPQPYRNDAAVQAGQARAGEQASAALRASMMTGIGPAKQRVIPHSLTDDEVQFLRACGYVAETAAERERKAQEASARFWRGQGYEVDAAGAPLPKDTVAWPSPKPEAERDETPVKNRRRGLFRRSDAAASSHEPQEDDQCPMI
jgi:hypothetical protein